VGPKVFHIFRRLYRSAGLCCLTLGALGPPAWAQAPSKVLNLSLSKSEFFRQLQTPLSKNQWAQFEGTLFITQKGGPTESFEVLAQRTHQKTVLWLKDIERVTHILLGDRQQKAHHKTHKASIWIPFSIASEESVEGFVLKTVTAFLTQNPDTLVHDEDEFYFNKALIGLDEHFIISPKKSDLNLEKIEFRVNVQKQVDTFWAYSKGRSLQVVAYLRNYKATGPVKNFGDRKFIPKSMQN